MIVILIVVAFRFKNILQFWKEHLSLASIIVTFLFLFLLTQSFYSTMIYSSKLRFIAGQIGIPLKLLLIILSICGFIVAFYFFNIVIEFFLNLIPTTDTTQYNNGNNCVLRKQIIFILATAIVTISICSKSSPLYPFNDWVDANCFLTVGKSILYGKIPYRDLFEQKGPLLYMLHSLAALVSETTFLGVYFLEILACAIFLFYSFKIVKLYYNSASVLLIPVLATIVYSAPCFCHGDSAEELCLPIFAFAIYIGLKSICRKEVPTNLECLAIGLTSACVLWIKFSLLGFYIGWICVPATILIKKRKITKLFQMISFIAIGVFITTLPILIYFVMNQALADLWTVYFYNNLFHYSTTSSESTFLFSLLQNLREGGKNILIYNPIPTVIMILGGLALAKKKGKADILFMLTSIIGTFLLVYIGGRRYAYYSLIFSTFASLGVGIFFEIFRNCYGNLHMQSLNILYKYRKHLICAVSIILTFVMCENTYLLHYKKSDLPQYQFAEIINQVDNATLLNYGFLDGGFYTTTGIIPNCKYFCNLNVPLKEIMDTQNEFVDQGKVDFVVTRNKELNSNLYECIKTTSFYLEGTEYTYSLYQLIEYEE